MLKYCIKVFFFAILQRNQSNHKIVVTLPSDFYYHTFKAGPDWSQVEMPFSAFKRSNSKTSKLNINDIRDFGIVAYGRDFKSDVSVSDVSFYY